MLDLAVIGIILLSVIIGILRGFIKEIFGLTSIFISILLTIRYRSCFTDLYNQYVTSEVIAGILSAITVFVFITITAIIVNGWVMSLLSSARCSVVDRFGGLLIGLVKGMVFSYILFFIIQTSCYALLPAAKEDEEVLPNWFLDSYYYNVFYIFNTYIDEMVPESTHDKIKELESTLQDIIDKKSANKNKKKLSKYRKDLKDEI
ncbi:CvpA family protein [Ehrlichia ruminantium]|uniref:CvpA family protein n=1 Tax=Ehrlichia ruminantium TaxID=779 RepID=A0AAE6QDP0_EHRRU|nr:CvpA family protein [Ehrlichia ruminantium]QGR02745.1 CvpA family protein [Ehrlichia ruminantium]QGR03665.1 CvpA family protein [Ehrlichia ruminantium]QGR04592.1 CvpA family protein [Ehrlichia ruminantium]